MKATCDKCGAGFESKESVAPCPECGELQRVVTLRDKPSSKQTNSPLAIAWLITIAGCVLALVLVFSSGSDRAEIQAKKEARQEAYAVLIDSYRNQLRATDPSGSVFGDVHWDGTFAVIQVSNIWHVMPYQIRYQKAQDLWKTWATITRPGDVDNARVKVVDMQGNAVAGSRAFAGSLIWCND